MISTVIKRNGSEAKFDQERITTAIYKAMLAVKNGSMDDAMKVSDIVVDRIANPMYPSNNLTHNYDMLTQVQIFQ